MPQVEAAALVGWWRQEQKGGSLKGGRGRGFFHDQNLRSGRALIQGRVGMQVEGTSCHLPFGVMKLSVSL